MQLQSFPENVHLTNLNSARFQLVRVLFRNEQRINFTLDEGLNLMREPSKMQSSNMVQAFPPHEARSTSILRKSQFRKVEALILSKSIENSLKSASLNIWL